MQKIKGHLFILFAIVVLSYHLFAGCRTTGPTAGTSNDVLEHQKQLDALEATVQRYEDAVNGSITSIEKLSSKCNEMGATVDSTIELFGQYQQLVEQLICNYNALRGANKNLKEYIDTSNNSTID